MEDTLFNRRSMIKAAAGLGAISTTFATTGQVAQAGSHSATPKEGLISIHKLGPVTFHTYTSPEYSGMVNAHVIETNNELYLIDTQFVQALASEFSSYVDSLGKPIQRIYLSHSHPDHLFGAVQFPDVEFVTSDEVLAEANSAMDIYKARKDALKDATEVVLPAGGLTIGTETWDGIEVQIGQVLDAEAAAELTFHIPEAGLYVAQDLLYANAHTFPINNSENWLAALEDMQKLEGIKVFGSGHGLPGAPGLIDDAIAYLNFQNQAIAENNDGESATAAILAKYPGYGAKDVLSFLSYRYQK
ncbi:MAG: MBL fold metallo-hydrolase [Alphaproteobacteria bacterium]